MVKPVLGRGLGALLNGGATSKPAPLPATTSVAAAGIAGSSRPGETVQIVSCEKVRPCPFQPRKDFSEAALKELADSIRAQGIVQPLIVRESAGTYEIIAGERRWRAAQMLGLKELPVIVRQADDRAVLEMAMIENLQRENLNPLEEAQGYAQLIGQFRLTQEQAAEKVGKSRTVVANALRLLKLPVPVQDHVRSGRLSVGHAKVVLGIAESTMLLGAVERVIREGLNVRQTEVLVTRLQERQGRSGTVETRPEAGKKDPHLARLEDKLREKLGTKVQLNYSQGKGAVEILFYSDAELERVLSLIGVEPD